MKKVLIIGATGSIGKVTRKMFLQESEDQLTLFSRSANRLTDIDERREIVISGSVSNQNDLNDVIEGQDVVFVALSGNLPKMASEIVASMKRMKVKRLIFISSMGIYNEIPASVGSNGNLESNSMLTGYRKAADIVEASGLDYTVIRPGWFDSSNDTNYQVTLKGEAFGGHDVSRMSIADLVVKCADEDLYIGESVGINRPE